MSRVGSYILWVSFLGLFIFLALTAFGHTYEAVDKCLPSVQKPIGVAVTIFAMLEVLFVAARVVVSAIRVPRPWQVSNPLFVTSEGVMSVADAARIFLLNLRHYRQVASTRSQVLFILIVLSVPMLVLAYVLLEMLSAGCEFGESDFSAISTSAAVAFVYWFYWVLFGDIHAHVRLPQVSL